MNDTNQISSWLEYITQFDSWFQGLGDGAKLLFGCIAFGLFARIFAASIPARSVSLWVRPVVLLVMVACPPLIYPALLGTDSVSHELRDPTAALRFQGLVYSLIAVAGDWIANRFLYQRFISESEDGNTQFITKQRVDNPMVGDSGRS